MNCCCQIGIIVVVNPVIVNPVDANPQSRLCNWAIRILRVALSAKILPKITIKSNVAKGKKLCLNKF